MLFDLFVFVQIVNLFNLFITYGDTFLPSPTSYDELYYEMIRMHHVFESLYAMGKHAVLEARVRMMKPWHHVCCLASPNVVTLTYRVVSANFSQRKIGHAHDNSADSESVAGAP